MPLYRALRKSVTEQGYALGCDVENELVAEDINVYGKIHLDGFFQYINEAMGNKAPINANIEVDYVEKIWFCPTDGMLPSPFDGVQWLCSSEGHDTLTNSARAADRSESESQSKVQIQEGFCVYADDELDDKGALQRSIREASRGPAEGSRGGVANDCSGGLGEQFTQPETALTERTRASSPFCTPPPRGPIVARNTVDFAHVVVKVEGEERPVQQTPLIATTVSVKREEAVNEAPPFVVQENSIKQEIIVKTEEEDVKPDLSLIMSQESRDLYALLCLFLDIGLDSITASTVAERLQYTVAYVRTIVESSKKYPAQELKLKWREYIDGTDSLITVLW
ncbi:hypothetical protein CBS101457_002214 [Exobasidium rhododendri]|nr:hypothetical protein CBS101457_002214 [Exobasidium rhododendri]